MRANLPHIPLLLSVFLWTDAGFIVILAETLDSREVVHQMEDTERYRLLGKYRTSRSRIGCTVLREVRGEMVITGESDFGNETG